MQTQHPSGQEHLNKVEKVISGRIVEAGADHLLIREEATRDEVTVRIDDLTHFDWQDEKQRGRLTDTGEVRVGYFIAGGVHKAMEVHVIEPGDGVPVADRLLSQVH